MAERRYAGARWESWIDRTLREAQARGEFDDLPGAGKPIADLGRQRDDDWWARRKLEDEGLTYVPPAVQLRKDVEQARLAIDVARTEEDVRRIIAEINERIIAANRLGLPGPPSTSVPLDLERHLDRWRARREGGAGA
ncbi:DUF1992 domain-containing protein [Euzebya sp.]|uniref:DnaJ family domain-containing protein n=1 Tax=Euzebya sp. TaxID=1971409 RepID=UPI00351272E6